MTAYLFLLRKLQKTDGETSPYFEENGVGWLWDIHEGRLFRQPDLGMSFWRFLLLAWACCGVGYSSRRKLQRRWFHMCIYSGLFTGLEPVLEAMSGRVILNFTILILRIGISEIAFGAVNIQTLKHQSNSSTSLSLPYGSETTLPFDDKSRLLGPKFKLYDMTHQEWRPCPTSKPITWLSETTIPVNSWRTLSFRYMRLCSPRRLRTFQEVTVFEKRPFTSCKRPCHQRPRPRARACMIYCRLQSPGGIRACKWPDRSRLGHRDSKYMFNSNHRPNDIRLRRSTSLCGSRYSKRHPLSQRNCSTRNFESKSRSTYRHESRKSWEWDLRDFSKYAIPHTTITH